MQRNHEASCGLDKAEKEKMISICKDLGMSQSNFVRNSILTAIQNITNPMLELVLVPRANRFKFNQLKGGEV